MGDLLMSSPALRALRETFQCKITLLTSSMAAGLASSIPFVDDVVIFDVPWVKTDQRIDRYAIRGVAHKLRRKHYDGAVIFTTFSQSPLPAAVLLFEAGISRVLAYSRENPYGLISDWVPEPEPQHFIRHQVQRDLALVHHIGARTGDDHLLIKRPPADVAERAFQKLWSAGLVPDKTWIVVHPVASDPKREYSLSGWAKACKEIMNQHDVQFVVTGPAGAETAAKYLAGAVGDDVVISIAGQLHLEEFIAVIDHANLVLSVNTVTAHLAAALQTPEVVLYALTNPQHAPWKGRGFVLPFSLPPALESRNELLRYARETYYPGLYLVSPQDIARCAGEILSHAVLPQIGKLVTDEVYEFNAR
jgi:ADP-heptose:LPS heptosyltransferase